MGIQTDHFLVYGVPVNWSSLQKFLLEKKVGTCDDDVQCMCYRYCWKFPEEYSGLKLEVDIPYYDCNVESYTFYIALLSAGSNGIDLDTINNIPKELLEKARKLVSIVNNIDENDVKFKVYSVIKIR